MIISFRCEATEQIHRGETTPVLPTNINTVALPKLQQLAMAQKLDDLRIPPGNRLEPLKHDRKGHHSIRVNAKYRVWFVWTDHRVEDVEIVDYH